MPVVVLAAALLGAPPAVDCVQTAARLWIFSDADLDLDDVLLQLGLAYVFGSSEDSLGIPRDPVYGAGCIREVADRGHAVGQGVLGALYADGLGILPDDVLAYKWLILSAMHGSESGRKARDLVRARLTAAQIAAAQQAATEWLESRP